MGKIITQLNQQFEETSVSGPFNHVRMLILRFRFPAIVLMTCMAVSAESQGTLTTWHPSVIAVNETVAGRDGHLYTKFELAENGDVRVTYEQQGGSKPLSGTILVISGHWMLVKGLQPEKGKETGLLDTAGVNSQMLLTLLSKGLPNGPPASGQTRKISVAEKTEPIRVATTRSSGVHLAPWSVKGSVTSVSGSTVNYSLDLKLEREENPMVHLEGNVSTPLEPLELPDTMSLSGWSVHEISPYQEQTRDGTVLNYGAKEEEVSARTLGELRAIDLH